MTVFTRMKRIGQYVRTIRYLKPVQVFGRIWFRLYRPSVRAAPALSVRRRSGGWRQSPLNLPSLLSPSRFRFLNEEHELLSAADWNNPEWEKLWLYNLHYFDDLNAEGAKDRLDWHRALIERWIAENPAGKGNGWESYPLSRRIVNWIKWAWNGNELPAGAPASLALQARYLGKRLEWHILGNHLLANAKALIFAGLFFEGPEADNWLTKGASIFSKQLEEQALADGGHFERSPMYHAQVLEDVLDVVNAIGTFSDLGSGFHGNDELKTGSDKFKDLSRLQWQCLVAAPRMLAWLRVMCHPDGEIALLNDSAFGGAAQPAALAEYAVRLKTGTDTYFPKRNGYLSLFFLKDTGYVRADCGEVTAFLDVAPIGPDYLPGHAHADTLGFELSLGRQRVIVDSGVSRYGDGPERLRQRGTAAHNTVEIDGLDSSEVWGGFRVARRAYPRDLHIDESEGIVSCAHDGYKRLPGKPIHRREWHFYRDGLTIRDEIAGSFQTAVGRLHFHPDVRLIPDSEADSAVRNSGSCDSGKLLLPDGRSMRWKIEKGRGRLSDTTWHPEFGVSIPNCCLEVVFDDRETVVNLTWENHP